ncbi:MAG: helicase, partial [Dehalococcoidaceae bacterium]|nr:helicase [Dehalococcoidaceae bacterium]
FSVPSDPIVLASTMNMATPFPDYQLPSAILKFRQGFGRLIRGSKDRGIFVLLDSRLSSKNYGHAFETSLDDVDLLKIDKQELSMLIERWSSNDD